MEPEIVTENKNLAEANFSNFRRIQLELKFRGLVNTVKDLVADCVNFLVIEIEYCEQ